MKLCICTIGFSGDSKWVLFRKEVEKILSKYPNDKYTYTFDSLSVSYVEGGTHVVCIDDEEIGNRIKEDLQNLVDNEIWNDFKLKN